jgi:hypothetical protein
MNKYKSLILVEINIHSSEAEGVLNRMTGMNLLDHNYPLIIRSNPC